MVTALLRARVTRVRRSRVGAQARAKRWVCRGVTGWRRALLRQVEGIGPLTALSFVLSVEHPYRFEKSRSVGAYLGLVPASDQSGERSSESHLQGEGDEMLRKLLVGSAHYILGPFGSDSDLRRHGEKIASRGGKNAKKRAVVAVARKLAVLLHACG